MDINLKICRLCLAVIKELNFETLDTVKLAMLKTLPLNLNPAYTTNALICSQCSDKLQHIFYFKTACLDNNDYLKTFLHYGSNFTLILEEIIVREVTASDGIKHEEEKVCRFCLKYFDIKLFTKLNGLEDIFLKDMLEKCFPEMDLTITKCPLMCHECMDMLQNQFNFVISCLDMDERIKTFQSSLDASSNNDQYNLGDVLKFDSKRNDLSNVKLEQEENNDLEYVSDLVVKKEEEFENIEESEFHINIKESLESDVEHEETISEGCIKIEENLKLDLDSDDTMSDGTHKSEQLTFPEPKMLEKNAYGMFVCPFCPHQTNRRDSLVKHFLTHTKKECTSQFSLFKCEECNFVSKYKSSLKWHVMLHKNPVELELFYCAKCPYKSKHKKHVRRHCKTHMTSKSQSTDTYQCQFCSLVTKDKAYIKQHCKTKHKKIVVLEEEFVKCEKCNYQSKNERNILIHMRTAHKIVKKDEPEKKYACESCSYRTHRLSHLKDHSLTHKSCDEVKMLSCPHCSFQTKYKNSLGLHIKRHEPGRKQQKRRRTDNCGTSETKSS